MARDKFKGSDRFLNTMQVVLRLLPVRTGTALMAYLVSRGRIRDALFNTTAMKGNLLGAFPELDRAGADRLTKQIAANFGRLVAEIVHMKTFKDGKQRTSIKVTTPEGATFDRTDPMIFVGAHVGCWELLPLAFGSDADALTIIYSQDKNPVVDGFLTSLRPLTGANYVEKATGLKPCLAAMENGGSLVLLVDQRVDSGLEVEFFGHPSKMTRLPARLSIKHCCPIVPFEVTRIRPGEIEVKFHDPILPNDQTGKDKETDLTQRMARVVQQVITRNRESWFCNKKRWQSSSG